MSRAAVRGTPATPSWLPAIRPGMQRVHWASYLTVPQAVTVARHHVELALAGVPAADDVVFCLNEIATNAVVHSRSGQPGGHFTVAADVLEGGLVAVAVTDQGGLWTGRAADTYPHGLEIVKKMAAGVRIDGDASGRTVWAIFPWQPPAPGNRGPQGSGGPSGEPS